jgi:hypothetical protein
MARDTRSPGKGAHTDGEVPHALEILIRQASADSFEDDDGAREDAWARKVKRILDAKATALRQRHARSAAAPRVTRISAELRAMDRGALLSRLDVLQRAPGVQIAHLSLSRLSDDDLRLLVAELEAVGPTEEGPVS